MCKFEILHQFGKRVKTKSQKFLGTNSYVCRSYRKKTGRGGDFLAPPILNRVKDHSFSMNAKFSKKLAFLTPWYAQLVSFCFQGQLLGGFTSTKDFFACCLIRNIHPEMFFTEIFINEKLIGRFSFKVVVLNIFRKFLEKHQQWNSHI